MPLSSTPLSLCAAVVAVATLVIATAPHNAVAGSVKVTSVASEQLNVQSIDSIQGSQDGSGSAAFAYKIIQRRNDDNPSDDDYNFLHTSVLGKVRWLSPVTNKHLLLLRLHMLTAILTAAPPLPVSDRKQPDHCSVHPIEPWWQWRRPVDLWHSLQLLQHEPERDHPH